MENYRFKLGFIENVEMGLVCIEKLSHLTNIIDRVTGEDSVISKNYKEISAIFHIL